MLRLTAILSNLNWLTIPPPSPLSARTSCSYKSDGIRILKSCLTKRLVNALPLSIAQRSASEPHRQTSGLLCAKQCRLCMGGLPISASSTVAASAQTV